MVNELNQHLDAPVSVENVSLGVLHTFPRISVSFDNVVVQGAGDNPEDTLLVLERASFSFDIWELLHNEYRINRLNLYKGELSINRRADGSNNFSILKEDTAAVADETESRMTFALEEVRLRDIQLNYIAEGASSTEGTMIFNDASFAGELSDEAFTMQARGDAFVENLLIDEMPWLSENEIIFDHDVEVNTVQNTWQLRSSEFSLDGMALRASGELDAGHHHPGIALEFSTGELEIDKVLAIIPEQYRVKLNDYEKTGIFSINGQVNREAGVSHAPELKIFGDLKNGNFAYPGIDATLSDISADYTLEKKSKHDAGVSFSLNNVEGNSGGRPFSGGFAFTNHHDPHIELDFNGIIDLELLRPFLFPEHDEAFTGLLQLEDLYLAGRVEDMKSPDAFNRVMIRGNFSLREGYYSPVNQEAEYKNLRGGLQFDGNDLLIRNFEGEVENSSFRLNGYINNLVSYFFNPQDRLVINADLYSENLDVEDLLWSTDATDNEKQEYEWALPEDIALNFDMTADRLQFQRFGAANFSGRVSFLDGILYLDGLTFSSMQGNVSMEGTMRQTDDLRFVTDLSAEINSVGINHLFYQCFDFGQDFIRSDHLEGNLDGNINLEMSWKGDLTPEFDNLYAIGDLHVTDGRLISFEPLTRLSSIVDQERLANLEFNELNNRILIKDNRVLIPEMDIRSNALDLLLSGEHHFNNSLDYYMRLNLHQVIFGKREDYRTEFGDVIHEQDDNLFFYIVMTGTSSDPSISLNSRKVRQELADQIEQEKELMEDRFGMESTASDDEEERRERTTPRREIEGDGPSRTEEDRDNAFDKLRQRLRDF